MKKRKKEREVQNISAIQCKNILICHLYVVPRVYYYERQSGRSLRRGRTKKLTKKQT